MPCTAVEMSSSDTPIRFRVFSPVGGKSHTRIKMERLLLGNKSKLWGMMYEYRVQGQR